MAYYPQKESDPVEMKNIFNSLYLMIKIFYDLNAQELPEHFEDNINIYMPFFLTLLSYDHPKLHSTVKFIFLFFSFDHSFGLFRQMIQEF
jgi:hypothetical protein